MLNEKLFIKETATVVEALKKLDEAATKILLVVNNKKVLKGIISDGDIRRSILKGHNLKNTIQKVYNKTPTVVFKKDFSNEHVQQILLKKEIEALPVIDENWHVVDFVKWEDVFTDKKIKSRKQLKNVPVIIMAGGKGTRLAPFTNILPKPLIPIGEKTILELIISEFYDFGVRDFLLTLNYKGEMIRAYFEGIPHDYRLNYIWEKEFNGTAASVRLAEALLPEVFIVSNCDIIVKADYAKVVAFHKKNGADITVLSSIQHHVVPYGVVEFCNGGAVTEIIEKPEYTFTINTGVYVLNKKCIDHIPENRVFHMTHLIEAIIAARGKVFTYPVNEKEYVDIGQWEEYRSVISKIRSY